MVESSTQQDKGAPPDRMTADHNHGVYGQLLEDLRQIPDRAKRRSPAECDVLPANGVA